MTLELRILLASAAIVCAAMFGYWAGWRLARDEWRRSSRYRAGERGSNPPPPGGRLIESSPWRLLINSSRPGAKPQFPPPQIIREDFLP